MQKVKSRSEMPTEVKAKRDEIEAAELPAGFSVKTRYYGGPSREWQIVVSNGDDSKAIGYTELLFRYTPYSKDDDRLLTLGTTNITTSKGEFTFDRNGVESSFSFEPAFGGHEIPPISKIVSEQVDRANKLAKRHDESVSVPGLPYVITEDKRKEISDKLKKGGSHQFLPAGFGTGRRLVASQPKRGQHFGAYFIKADKETAGFFGVKQLFIEEFDCD